MAASAMYTIRLTPQQRESIETFRTTLQERTPHTNVTLADAIRYAVSTASAVVKNNTPISAPVQQIEPDRRPYSLTNFDETKKLVNLAIDIDEDRQFYVNRIAFTGNTTTRDKVIRREIMVPEGSIFNSAYWDISIHGVTAFS